MLLGSVVAFLLLLVLLLGVVNVCKIVAALRGRTPLSLLLEQELRQLVGQYIISVLRHWSSLRPVLLASASLSAFLFANRRRYDRHRRLTRLVFASRHKNTEEQEGSTVGRIELKTSRAFSIRGWSAYTVYIRLTGTLPSTATPNRLRCDYTSWLTR